MAIPFPQKESSFQPLFGWSRKDPPDPQRYLLPICSEFVARTQTEAGDTFKPSQALVERVIHEVFDKDGPRFAVLTGLHKVLGLSKEQVYAFQRAVVDQVSEIRGYKTKDKELTLNGKSYTGLKDNSIVAMHHDGLALGKSPFISLAYGPFKGLASGEGIPRVGDLKEWVQDNRKGKRFKELLGLKRKLGTSLEVARAFYDEQFNSQSVAQFEVVKGYAIKLDDLDFEKDIPVSFINNNYINGVVHGATALRGEFFQRQEKKERPLNRVMTQIEGSLTCDT